jgi:riboflavin kinase/FMN adenylyltransferase
MIVATGFFDGVHLGHRQVIRQLVETAAARGDESMVLTFWPHPRTVLQDDARSLRLLSTLAEKKALLTELGVDHVEVLPFSREFSRWTAREYLEEVVIGRYGGRAILLGYDNRFGSDGLAPEEIARLAASLGLDVIRPDCIASRRSLAPDTAISSTRIRKELEEGRVEEAAAMLGYPYRLHGVVVAGNRLGRTIGFPTANMQLYEPLKLVPANGVYQVKVETLGQTYTGMCNIGVRPTVGAGNARTIETHILDFNEDIYGLDITISFLRKVRDERRFDSLDDLRAQLERDRAFCFQ